MWLHLLQSSSMLLPGENNAQERPLLVPCIRSPGTGTTKIEEARTLEAALAQCAENPGH